MTDENEDQEDNTPYKYPILASRIKQRDNNFTYHAPKDDQPYRYTRLRNSAKFLVDEILGMTPESREQSLALTNLEQAIFWANAAIARNE